MKCPICKKTIPDNVLKCPYCKNRTGLICKNCNTVNSIFDFKCKKCGKEILKLCPNCNSVNFPNTNKCRKCGYVFSHPPVNDDLQEVRLEYPANLVSQQSAKNILVKGILSSDKKIFLLNNSARHTFACRRRWISRRLLWMLVQILLLGPEPTLSAVHVCWLRICDGYAVMHPSLLPFHQIYLIVRH